jgi:hypothetical protein
MTTGTKTKPARTQRPKAQASQAPVKLSMPTSPASRGGPTVRKVQKKPSLPNVITKSGRVKLSSPSQSSPRYLTATTQGEKKLSMKVDGENAAKKKKMPLRKFLSTQKTGSPPTAKMMSSINSQQSPKRSMINE